ncbi:hypothetical protein LTR35_017536 [Friedmanniomyces endolithicus]|nr:hypothetical protein LTR35_017536 [Friedmanniomyces endolithicus]KAK0971377.1 hypothetical protein LTR54_017797 [Friedmanniomyces endolithicus]
MAAGLQETHPQPISTRCAGVKRNRALEAHTPRKTARFDNSHQEQLVFSKGSKGADCYTSRQNTGEEKGSVRAHQKTSSRKRLKCSATKQHPTIVIEEHRKLQRGPAKEDRLALDRSTGVSEEERDPISYWVSSGRWPPRYIDKCEDMENILARKRALSSRSRKNSDTESSPTSSSNNLQSQEQKSAEYNKSQYATVLTTKGILMKSSSDGVSSANKDLCKDLLEQEQTYPKDTLFGDDLFKSTCENVQDRNETRVIRDIALLIVPSAEIFATRDFAVGFRRETFAQHQLDRMHPVVGDFNDQSFFMATWYMYFPFLTCEVKCGAAALDIADRQNAHSTAIAVRAVVELFPAVKREKELHREILAFSVSHDQRSVRIYGYYAEIGESETKYYRHAIHIFDFTALDGKERWTAYKFTKNVYDHWMPIHFKRICSAIEQIPAGISFSESQSELHF